MKKSLFISLGLIAAGSMMLYAIEKDASTEQKIDELLRRMTLEEKIGQLNQLSGGGDTKDMLPNIHSASVGSILNEVSAKRVNSLQREAVEHTRMGIPLIFARDVIHGYKTIFPIPLGQAATWDDELIEAGARISAEEASSDGIRWTFSPMVDISRDARWGRIAESFGEDPYLAGRLGMAMVRGYQGNDLSNPTSIAACVKHFAGYGAAEGGRDYNTTWIPEQYLRDVYLYPFEQTAKGGAATFMCSFNDINGVPSSGNKHLLQDILRDEWGWDGLMCSDWGSIEQMIPHGYSENMRVAARQAVEAGVDVDMMSYAYISQLKDLVEKGEVSMDRVDDLVRNVLRLKYRLGLFDNPYVDENKSDVCYSSGNLAVALRAAEEEAILLKNSGVLPLKKNVKKIAICGPMADAAHDQNGTWSFDMEKTRTITPLKAFCDFYGDKRIIDARGLSYSRDKDSDKIASAVRAASSADVILYFAGEEAVLSGEAHSRADITLPGLQREELKALGATGKPIVLVVMAGRPLVISEESELADAVIYEFHPGTMGGEALLHVINGDFNPGGRLPVSMPRYSGQEPLYYSHKNTGRPAYEVMLIDDIPLEAGQTSTGCTSFYLDAGNSPLYPFGYGLSYTQFSYGAPQLSAVEMGAGGEITVTCDVTNTGSCTGTEVVQLYVQDVTGSLIRPIRELKGYKKIELAAGATEKVSFTLPANSLYFHNKNNERVVEAGKFNLWVSPDAVSGAPVEFSVTETSIIK